MFGEVQMGKNEVSMNGKVEDKVDNVSRVKVSRSDKVQIGKDCKFKAGKFDKFEVGKVRKVQVGKFEVGKAKVGNLDKPEFFDTWQKLGTNGKIKNNRRRRKLLQKR